MRLPQAWHVLTVFLAPSHAHALGLKKPSHLSSFQNSALGTASSLSQEFCPPQERKCSFYNLSVRSDAPLRNLRVIHLFQIVDQSRPGRIPPELFPGYGA